MKLLSLIITYNFGGYFLFQCKPEQVQAIRNSADDRAKKRDQLTFRVGDVITVIDKT